MLSNAFMHVEHLCMPLCFVFTQKIFHKLNMRKCDNASLFILSVTKLNVLSKLN